METKRDANICDVQFSLRVPKSMAEEIAERAAIEGIKPASWIRKTLSNAINVSTTQMQQVTKSDFIRLLEKDQEVQEFIRKIVSRDVDKETEMRIDDFEKMLERQQREIASMEKQIVALERAKEESRLSIFSRRRREN